MYGIIYKLTCLITWKPYVGQTTKTLDERFIQHSRTDSLIGNAIRKYGAENFLREVLEVCDTQEQLNEREKFWIAYFNSKVPNGYNLTDGGEGMAGRHHTPESKAKMSASQCGKKLSAKARANIAAAKIGEKNPFFGKHHTSKSLAKMSAAHKGKKRSKQTCANISAALTGRTFSDTHRANLSAAKKGTIPSDKTRENMSAARIGDKNHNYGKPRDSKTCLKIATTQRGYTPFKNLAAELDAHQMTYTKFAELLGYSAVTISDKMRGRRKFMDKDKTRTSEFFGKPIEYLFERDDDGVYVKPSTPHRRESPYPNLIHELDARQLSYAALARLMDWDKNSFARKMRGDRSFMDKEKNKLADFFGKPVEYLFKRNG